jgi:hypothetical protein
LAGVIEYSPFCVQQLTMIRLGSALAPATAALGKPRWLRFAPPTIVEPANQLF